MSSDEIRTGWSEVSGGIEAAMAYQQHFDDLEASGADIHGEARFVAGLEQPPARILDAGCGTGRVAIQLGQLGYHVVGVDADRHMIDVARERDPGIHFVRADLATLQLRSQTFDVAVLAGNVVPLLAPGSLDAVMQRIAAHVHHGGQVVAGFGLDSGHLPPRTPVTSLEDYDAACTAAGLSLVDRWSTWGRDPYPGEGGYAVSLHRLT